MLKRLLIVPVVAIAAVLAMAVPANAATVYPVNFAVVNQAAIITDDGAPALRIKNVNDWSSYAYTGYLQGVLNSKPGQQIQVCVKYKGNIAGYGAALQVNNGVWSVSLPIVFSSAYEKHCVTTTNSTTQPYGVVWVGGLSGGSPNILIRNIQIT